MPKEILFEENYFLKLREMELNRQNSGLLDLLAVQSLNSHFQKKKKINKKIKITLRINWYCLAFHNYPLI